VLYLGIVLTENGVSASADKVKAVKEYITPNNAKDVRAFLSLAVFYRRQVQKFAGAARPLTTWLMKNQGFIWGLSQQEAIKDIKKRLSTTLVLACPNFDIPFIIPTDASKVTVAAILSQV